MAKNPIYRRLIHTNRWLVLRKRTLTERPLCQRCLEEGLMASAATEVHHIVPCETANTEKEMARLMFDPHNLRALCHDCHVKTHTEMGRSGKAAAKRINEDRTKRAIEKLYGDPGGHF